LDGNAILGGNLDNGCDISSSLHIDESYGLGLAAKVPWNGVDGIVDMTFGFDMDAGLAQSFGEGCLALGSSWLPLADPTTSTTHWML
jgi:hypothetical protein